MVVLVAGGGGRLPEWPATDGSDDRGATAAGDGRGWGCVANRGGLSEGEERGGEVGWAWSTVAAVDGWRRRCSAANGRQVLQEKQSFNIYKPQVQGVSMSTWGVVRRELCFQLLEFTRASQSRRDQWWRGGN